MAAGRGSHDENGRSAPREPMEWTDETHAARPLVNQGPTPLCAAKNKDGNPCKAYAVKGSDKCFHHGNGTRASFNANMTRQTIAGTTYLQQTFGGPREVGPDEALLEEVHRTAGHVAWLQEKLFQSDPLKFAEEIWYYRQKVDSRAVFTANQAEAAGVAYAGVWVDLYQKERMHLVKVCEAALRAGVEERRVRVAERQADQIGLAISQMLHELGHDPGDMKVRAVAFRALQLASGEAEYVDGEVVAR